MSKNRYPCVLLINDIHISKDNIPEFFINWNEALEVCRQMNIKHIALGGDLFQSRSAQTLDVLLAVHDAFLSANKSGIYITVTNGNHDKVNQEELRGYCHVYNQHANVTVVDDFITLVSDDWSFALHMIPYFPENGSFTEKLACLIARGLDEGRLNFLYIHEGINGALAHTSEKELPADIFGDFNKTFVGHYHNRCLIAGTTVEFIGSSRQHNFGEDDEKGYTVIYNDGSHEFIRNKANVRYQVIDVPVEKVNVHLTDLIGELKADKGCKIKVRITSSTGKAKSIDKEALIKAGASKVEILTDDIEVTEIISTSLFEKFDSRKIQESYETFCQEKNIDDTLGLSYLNKIEIFYVETN